MKTARTRRDLQLGKSRKQTVWLDLQRLLDTRMLVTGASGSGKSWLLRLIAEQAATQVPVLILDPEGEYGTLREQLDLVLVGDDGDIRPTVKTAPVIARRLFELRASAVLNLFDLPLEERREFVRDFIGALMATPRATWHPSLVLIDEAHTVCPERGGSSSCATQTVISLLAQGRKRGLGTVLATQRLSKLHKDAAAEANNVAVGRITLDIDITRARDLLGLNKADAQSLRELEPGQWYSRGPAVTPDGVTLFRAAKVRTTHPQSGQRHLLELPAPSQQLSEVLAELAALAHDTEGEGEDPETLDDARAEIARLRAQLSALRQEQRHDPQVTARAVADALHQERAKHALAMAAFHDKLSALARELQPETSPAVDPPAVPPPGPKVRPVATETSRRPAAPKPPTPPRPTTASEVSPAGARRMLTVLAQHPQGCDAVQLGLLARLSSQSGTFGSYLGQLRANGWIRKDGPDLVATPAGIAALGEYTPLPMGRALVSHWLDWCGPSGGKRRILEALVGAGPQGLDRDTLASVARLSSNSGTFGGYLSNLRRAKLIEGKRRLVAAATLLDAVAT